MATTSSVIAAPAPTAAPLLVPKCPPLDTLAACLRDLAEPVSKRMRAIYYLRLLGTPAAISVLSEALRERRNSQLVRHELAYVLGQLQQERACGVLEAVLDAPDEDVMVRHECAEALGAIGSARSLPVLERGAADTCIPCPKAVDASGAGSEAARVERNPLEVRETCAIALDLIRWKVNGRQGEAPLHCACMSPYTSVDPAPPTATDDLSTLELEKELRDETRSLFDRYRAMFSLRNRVPDGDTEAVAALGRTLVSDQSSVLLRHEVAYVLGQTQSPVGLASLRESLQRKNEHSMVRHESAEALGAIVGEWDACREVLEQFVNDEDPCVAESCLVALDVLDYWGDEATEDSAQADCEPATVASASVAKQAGGFKRLKESLTVSATTTVSTAPACAITLPVEASEQRSLHRYLTASDVRVDEAFTAALCLNRLIGVAGNVDTAETTGGTDSITGALTKRVLLFLCGKLKRKGFYADQEQGTRNFDEEGVLHYLATSGGAKASFSATASDREFDTSWLVHRLPQKGKLRIPIPGCVRSLGNRAWLQIDFGPQLFAPTSVALRHGGPVDICIALALQAWTLLGSIDGDDWQVLQQVYDDASLGDGGPYATKTFHLDDEDDDASVTDDEDEIQPQLLDWYLEGRGYRPRAFRFLRLMVRFLCRRFLHVCFYPC
eukprot:INCI14741.4.p1 GENE.INCI14741.4~~INCI14741.4.p1  ORF type:complete len:669 (+),score=114.03 INCI14741.4:284-2290(+)